MLWLDIDLKRNEHENGNENPKLVNAIDIFVNCLYNCTFWGDLLGSTENDERDFITLLHRL